MAKQLKAGRGLRGRLQVISVCAAGRLLTPSGWIENAEAWLEEGRVAHVGERGARPLPQGSKTIDLGAEAILGPGFIEMHAHGAMGYDAMMDDAEGLRRWAGFLWRRGVSAFLPTTVTAPKGLLLRALERLGREIECWRETRAARPLGVHLEGPFLSPEKRGVHPLESLLAPSPELLREFYGASGGHLRLLTLAPETPGALETIAAARELGVATSLGHSMATSAQTRRAIDAGARHGTHLFNAMRPLDHREPGVAGELLRNDSATVEVIADGHHVAPEMISVAWRCKGAKGLALVSDALSAAGMPEGLYRLGEFEVELRGGRCEAAGRLAGSVLTLDAAVVNLQKFVGCGLDEAWRAASERPAEILGLKDWGRLEPGAEGGATLWRGGVFSRPEAV